MGFYRETWVLGGPRRSQEVLGDSSNFKWEIAAIHVLEFLGFPWISSFIFIFIRICERIYLES